MKKLFLLSFLIALFLLINNNISAQANAGSDQTGCTDNYILTATNPFPGTGTWTVVSGSVSISNPSLYNSTIVAGPGENILRWTVDIGGNITYDEVSIINESVTIPLTGLDKSVCTNSTQIIANPPGYGETGLWTNTGTATIVNPTANQTIVNNLDPGITVFSWTIRNNFCSSVDDLYVTNNQVSANAGLDLTICTTTTSMAATSPIPGTGVWQTTTPGVLISNPSSYNTSVSNVAFGNNNFLWTVTYNGCTDVDEVIITNDLPQNVTAGPDQQICSGTTYLAGSNPGIGAGTWTITSGFGIISETTSNLTTVSGLALGENTFRWTVTIGSCSASSQIRVYQNSLNVNAGNDRTICNENSIQLDGTIPGPGVTGLWIVNGGTGTFANATMYNTVVSGIAEGTNTYHWALNDGRCTYFDEIEIINNTPDLALVGAPQDICSGSTSINAVRVFNGTGTWSVKSGSATIANPTSNNTVVTAINKGLNTFTWTVTKSGCSLSADINVTNNEVSAYIAEDQIVICTPTHTANIISNPVGTGETGTWTKISAGAGTITNTSSNVTTVTGLGNGDTFFRWTINKSTCIDSDDVRITNNYYNTSAFAAGPTTLCINSSPIMGSSIPVGATGLWSSASPDVTFDNRSQVSTIVRNLPPETSSFTWTVTKDGCSSPASFNLTNNAIYTSAGGDQIVCQTNTNLNALAILGTETGLWTVTPVTVLIANSTSPTSAVSNLGQGMNTFTWTISGNGCTATDQVIVSNNAFMVTAGNDQISCGPSYNLAASDPISGTGLWTILGGTGVFAIPTSFATTVSNMTNGANTFRWTVNRNGCAAFDDVSITNDLYEANAGSDRSICSNQATVSAQPLNPAWGANGVWTLQTGGGVFGSPTLASTLVTGLSSGDNRIVWTVTKGACLDTDDIVITNNSIMASAGIDETTCNNFAVLSASPLSPTGVGYWTAGGVSVTIENPTSATTNVTNLQQGINTLAWTVTDKGCTGTSTVRVTSNFFLARAGNDQILTVDNAILDGRLPDPTATGVWSVFSGAGNFSNPDNPFTLVSNLGYGINTYRWTVLWNGCSAHDNVNIIYNVLTADAGPDQAICSSSLNLNANLPTVGTGRWSVINGGGTIVQPDNNLSLVNNIAPGVINVYRWTVSINGFEVFDDVTVVNNSFTIDAGIDLGTCENSTPMFAEPAGIGGTGVWTVLSGTGSFADPGVHNTGVTNLGYGQNLFQWTVTRKGCADSDEILVTYHVSPVAAFDVNNNTGCSPLEVYFSNISTGAIFYKWDFVIDDINENGANSHSKTYIAQNGKDSSYSIKLIALNDAGCSDTTEHQINVTALPKLIFSANPVSQVFPNKTVSLENLSNLEYTNYVWNFGDGSQLTNGVFVSNFVHSYSSWGLYEISLEAENNGCIDSVKQTIEILKETGIDQIDHKSINVYPNPSNGIFTIDFDNLSGLKKMDIYNQNGQKVFETEINGLKENLDLSRTESGIYFINIQVNKESIRYKIIINH